MYPLSATADEGAEQAGAPPRHLDLRRYLGDNLNAPPPDRASCTTVH